MNQPIYDLREIPTYAEVFTVNCFKQMVIDGMLIDDDGNGYWATSTAYDRSRLVFPSQASNMQCPMGLTHIAWFNR